MAKGVAEGHRSCHFHPEGHSLVDEKAVPNTGKGTRRKEEERLSESKLYGQYNVDQSKHFHCIRVRAELALNNSH